jgi:hypothetical protein
MNLEKRIEAAIYGDKFIIILYICDKYTLSHPATSQKYAHQSEIRQSIHQKKILLFWSIDRLHSNWISWDNHLVLDTEDSYGLYLTLLHLGARFN